VNPRIEKFVARLAVASRPEAAQVTIKARPGLADVLEAGGARREPAPTVDRATGNRVLDQVARAAWTAGAVLIGVLITDMPWKAALTFAVCAAVASCILVGLALIAKVTELPFWIDVLVGMYQAFIAGVASSVAACGVFDVAVFSWSKALEIGAVAAAAALARGVLTRRRRG
jgi:hypothetical protein